MYKYAHLVAPSKLSSASREIKMNVPTPSQLQQRDEEAEPVQWPKHKGLKVKVQAFSDAGSQMTHSQETTEHGSSFPKGSIIQRLAMMPKSRHAAHIPEHCGKLTFDICLLSELDKYLELPLRVGARTTELADYLQWCPESKDGQRLTAWCDLNTGEPWLSLRHRMNQKQSASGTWNVVSDYPWSIKFGWRNCLHLPACQEDQPWLAGRQLEQAPEPLDGVTPASRTTKELKTFQATVYAMCREIEN
ncbi:hypothetical protein BKA70DRAFT_1242281 [Coprinopsis sp. MPI-PUGE-AT-0042]|nr:hypothetical protein BKA70DRAFT_1242281 [Coprinopsis sp. MPI-PUGE-AT-0042]